MHVADSCYQRKIGAIDISDGGVCGERVSAALYLPHGGTCGCWNRCFHLCAGDALSSLKALRDAGRFVGKEDTVPLRLLYSRHNHSQITQDELSTRVKASSGSAQVHNVFRMERERERGASTCRLFPACLCLHWFISSSALVLRGEINN